MSGPDDSAHPEVPSEFAATYAEAYRRALESGEYDELNTGIHPIVVDPEEAARLIPEVAPQHPGEAGTHRVPEARPPRDPNRWVIPAIVALVAVLLVFGAYGLGKALSDDDPRASNTPDVTTQVTPSRTPKPTPKPTPTVSDLPTTSVDGAWDGDVEQVEADRARATCRAPASIDSAGDKVVYKASNTLDDDPTTAWRCNGMAVGESIRFRFDDEVDLGEVGLIPGYAKTDPASGADRYAENNRIIKVRWILGGGVVVEQTLDPSPGNREVQALRIPRTTTDEVTLEILAVDPGSRNTTAISTVTFGAVED